MLIWRHFITNCGKYALFKENVHRFLIMENELRQHLLRIKDIEKTCFNACDVLYEMFDEHVKILESYNEDTYHGSSYVIYEYKQHYFYVSESFGSCPGCDEWIENNSENHVAYIDRIVSNIILYKNLWEIPFDIYYSHPTWRKNVFDLMESHHCLDLFNKNQEKLVLEREQETNGREEMKSREIEKIQHKAKEIKEAEERRDIEESIIQLIDYFNNNSHVTDPFFNEKSSGKYRLLKFFTDSITEKYDEYYQQKKKEAEKILATVRMK